MIQLSDIKSGSTVKVIPLGIQSKICYNNLGVIAGIYVYDSDTNTSCKLNSNVTSSLQKKCIIPSRVRIPDSSIEGVFYIDPKDIPLVQLYENTLCDYLLSILNSNDLYKINFIAYNLETPSITKYNAYQQDSNLNLLGFKSCSSFSVSKDMKQKNLRNLGAMKSYPYILGYLLIENKNGQVCTSFISSKIKFMKVNKVDRFVNPSGYIYADITDKDERHFSTSYTDVVKYNIQKKSVIALDVIGSQKVVWCSDKDNNIKKVNNEIYCDTCSTLIHVPTSGYIRCPYNNCMSNMYNTVKHMLLCFHFPVLDYTTYQDLIAKNKLRNIIDIFDIDEYKDCHINCTLNTLLNAICPVGIVRTSNFFDKFVECAGSADAVNHYLDNPDQILSDMSNILNRVDIDSYSRWISIDENRLIVSTFMSLDNIDIQKNEIALNDVPQLLRNTTVFLEGDFRIGSYATVANILKSYGATISTVIDNRVTCFIYGDLNSPASQNRQIAESYHIPVYNECTYFNEYGIYDDIKEQQHKEQ